MPHNTTPPAFFDIHGRLDQNFKRMESLIEQLESDTDPRVRIAATAEMRRHIDLAARTLELALRVEAIKEFQAGVMEALASSRLTVRSKIMALFEARAAEKEGDSSLKSL